MWHIDGHDKLKPYGFCIHGAVDGFSRKILWCHVDQTNNDPWYIAKYYYDYITSHHGENCFENEKHEKPRIEYSIDSTSKCLTYL